MGQLDFDLLVNAFLHLKIEGMWAQMLKLYLELGFATGTGEGLTLL
jgi:hypothetical protein